MIPTTNVEEPYYTGLIEGYKIERALDAVGNPGSWREITNVSDMYFTDTDVATNTIYWYRIRAQNWVGISPYSDPVAAMLVPPIAPSELQAFLGDTNQVDLQWYNYSFAEDGFKVERAVDTGGIPGAWSEIGTATNEGFYYYTDFTDNQAVAYSTNWYRVRAFNVAGFSPYTDPVSIELVPPLQPVIFTASGITPNDIFLEWYDSSANIAGYKLERAQDAGGTPGVWKQITQFSNTLTYSDFNDLVVLANQMYWYRVRAYNWIGDSAYSDAVRVSTFPPDAPVNLTATNDWRNQITLAWINTDTNNSVQGFNIERALDAGGAPGAWIQIGTAASYQTTYADSALTEGATYWYRINAYNGLGYSPYSNEATATVRKGDFVRVMQWNLEHALGRQANNSASAAQAVARIVNYNQPDVLLFCEVDAQGLSQADNVAALIDWVTNNVPYLGSQPGGTFYVSVSSQTDGFLRNAAISRFPILDDTTYNDGLRGLHAFRTQISPENALQVFHAHLKCCADDCSRKQAEAEFDSGVIGTFAGTNSLPYLFAGDWNEDEQNSECPLSGIYHPIQTIREGAKVADFKPTTLSGEYRTWSSQTSTPSIRFDYILAATNRLAPISGYVFSSEDWQNHGIYDGFYYSDSYYASDHYCVFASYFFPRSDLQVSPETLASSGFQGGPFAPTAQTYTLSNASAASLTWTLNKTTVWLDLSASNGVLAAGQTTNIVATINPAANNLAPGLYADALTFSNTTAGGASATRVVSLGISSPALLSVTPSLDLASIGPAGGPFVPSLQIYALSNAGIARLTWTGSHTANWVSLSADGGALDPGVTTNILVSVNANAAALSAGNYSDAISFANTTTGAGSAMRAATLTVTSFGFFDDFSTFNAGNLVGQRNWVQALASSTLPLKIADGQVVIPGTQTGDNQDAIKNFSPTNGTVYYGMTLTVSNAPTSTSPSYFAALYTGNNAGGFANYRLSARGIGGGMYVLAAHVTGQAANPFTFGGTSLAYGTQHRVIVEADGGGTLMRVFLDPTSSDVTQQAPDFVNSIGGGTPPAQVGSFVFSQFNSGSAPILGVAVGKVVVIDNFAQAYAFLAGTTPAEVVHIVTLPPWITSVIQSDNDLLITWQAEGGTTNLVQAAANPGGPYSNISPPFGTSGAQTLSTYRDAGAKTNNSSRFYRIRVSP